MKILGILTKSSDLLSEPVQLLYKGNKRPQTYIGGLLSIIISIFTLVSIFVLGLEIFYKNNRYSRFSKDYTDNYTQTLEDFPIIFSISLPGTGEIPNMDQYLWIHARYYEMGVDNSTNQLYLKEHALFVEKCDPDVHFGKYKDIIMNSSVPLATAYCINPNKIDWSNGTIGTDFPVNFMNPYAQTPSHFTALFVEDCYAPFTHRWGMYYPQNKTCASPSDIESMLSYFFLYVYHIDSYVDLNDYENPRKPFVTSSTKTLSKSTYKQEFIRVKNTKINTDSGFLLSSTDTMSFPQLDEYHFEVAVGDNQDLIMELDLETTHLVDVYDRRYLKVQELMAQVGGLFKFLVIFGEIITRFFVNKQFLIALANNFTNFQTDDKVINKNSNPNIGMHTSKNYINVEESYSNNKNSISNVKIIPLKINDCNSNVKIKYLQKQKLSIFVYVKSFFCKTQGFGKKEYDKIFKVIKNSLGLETYLKTLARQEELISLLLPESLYYVFDDKLEIDLNNNLLSKTQSKSKYDKAQVKQLMHRGIQKLLESKV